MFALIMVTYLITPTFDVISFLLEPVIPLTSGRRLIKGSAGSGNDIDCNTGALTFLTKVSISVAFLRPTVYLFSLQLSRLTKILDITYHCFKKLQINFHCLKKSKICLITVNIFKALEPFRDGKGIITRVVA